MIDGLIATGNKDRVFQADVRIDGNSHEFVVAADGTLVHNEVDDEADEKPATRK